MCHNNLRSSCFTYTRRINLNPLPFFVAAYKTTTILLDGKRVKLQLWDTSGQGRFCTIIRSYSRGAQGVILVYDITNKWSFDGIDRWLKEVEEHAPGVPKVLVGNRLHLEFKRQVASKTAEMYAMRHKMACFEISPLCDFNIRESFCELARMALHRNGMERIWRSNKVLSLQELCCRTIVRKTASVYAIDTLPLPTSVKSHLKSYALTSSQCFNHHHQYGTQASGGLGNQFNSLIMKHRHRTKIPTTPSGMVSSCGGGGGGGSGMSTRNSCSIS